MSSRYGVAIGGLLIMAGLVTAGCSEAPVEEYRTVTVNGAAQMIAGPLPAGKLHVRLYNLWYLDGELRHPLEEIEDFTSDTATFSHTFEYPLHKGTGLAVHAWLDTDEDGVFCTPSSRLDPSGLTALEETPEDTVEVTVKLADNCRAANFFYPPAI